MRDLLEGWIGLEREGVSRNVGLPVLDAQRVLRRFADALAGDDVFARDRLGAGFDPDLPVGFQVAECQVVALDAIDDALADHGGLDHVDSS